MTCLAMLAFAAAFVFVQIGIWISDMTTSYKCYATGGELAAAVLFLAVFGDDYDEYD